MNNKTSKINLNLKNTIFNKFYLEFIVFFIILFISTILNLVIYLRIKTQSIKMLLSFITMIVTIISLYSFGYIVSQKRKLLNKYFPSVLFAFIFLVIWIFSVIFKNSEGFIAELFCNTDVMIQTIHNYIFSSINLFFNIEIPSRIFCFLTPLFVYLGNRKSRKRELFKLKKEKINNTKEEYNGSTNI